MPPDIKKSDIEKLSLFLSKERLRKLSDLTGSEKAAIEIHQRTLNLGASLLNVIGTVEIALRNSVYGNLCRHFGVSDWLSRPSASFEWRDREKKGIRKAQSDARRAKYLKLKPPQKKDIDAAYRYDQLTVHDGNVIPELTFAFWKRLYGPRYEHKLWKPTLKKTFPNKKIERSAVEENLEKIYQARNRLAHHEPVLHDRFHNVLSSIEFIIENLGESVPNSQAALARLLAGDIEEVKRKAEAIHKYLATFRE